MTMSMLRQTDFNRQDDLEWPKTLIVISKSGYAGNYNIVPGLEPNGLPLWKSERGNDWVFCGTGGQWFIGDIDEYKQNFVCDTGNIASFEENAGRMPDEIGAGGWLFFNGTEWMSDPGINIISEFFTAEDQEATIEANKQHDAATRIQRRHRGNTARRLVHAEKEEDRRDDAAVLIQKQIRGSLTRAKLSGDDLDNDNPDCAFVAPDTPELSPEKTHGGFMSRARNAASGIKLMSGGKKEKRQADYSASKGSGSKAKRNS